MCDRPARGGGGREPGVCCSGKFVQVKAGEGKRWRNLIYEMHPKREEINAPHLLLVGVLTAAHGQFATRLLTGLSHHLRVFVSMRQGQDNEEGVVGMVQGNSLNQLQINNRRRMLF